MDVLVMDIIDFEVRNYLETHISVSLRIGK